MTPARDVLKVIHDGEELPGIVFYGLVSRGGWANPAFPINLWPSGGQVDDFMLHGEAWEIPCWSLALTSWPAGDAWRNLVQATLQWICENGSVVGWMSAEGIPFCDPPFLFDPDCMSGGVLAYVTPDGNFECTVDLDGPLQAVQDGTLRSLRSYGAGLVDAVE
jgi:hypothetical protein